MGYEHQCRLNDQLRLRPRDQNTLVNGELQAEKFFVANKIGDRLVFGAAGDERIEFARRKSRDAALVMRKHFFARYFKRVRQKDLRVDRRFLARCAAEFFNADEFCFAYGHD